MWIAVALAVTFLALPSLTVAQELAGISSFMMPPRTTWATTQPSASNAVVVEEVNQSGVGFRIIRLRASVKGKKQAAIDLARSKLIEPGDILLSFRPLWDKTLAYAHMQLGVSHSAVAFLVSEGGEQFVMTLESPISYSSPLNAPEHYSDLDAIHVIRPTLSEAHKRNLEKWARLVLLNKSRFGFFSDYSLPMYKRGLGGVTSAKDQVRLLADILIGSNTDSRFESYCSEFVWTLMGLRNCDPAAFDSTCIKPLFSTSGGMMTGIIPGLNGDSGLIQGPDSALTFGEVSPVSRVKVLTESVFVDVLTDESQLAGRMSSGHMKVARDNRENMKIVNMYYASGEPTAIATQINAGLTENVSPTSFLIRSNSKVDGLHYVGTIVFDR